MVTLIFEIFGDLGVFSGFKKRSHHIKNNNALTI